jgi:hypothetical protein
MSFANRLKLVSQPKPVAAAAEAPCNRRSRRKQTALPAMLTFENMRIAVPCTVIDMSGTGARISLSSTAKNAFGELEHLPSKLTLMLKADHMQVDCGIVWRRDGKLGLRFLGPPRHMPKS